MRRCVVTGGCGFIGSHFVRRLFLEIDCESIIVLDNAVGMATDKCCHAKVAYYEGDIRNIDFLKQHIQQGDTIFHFAAIARTPWCVQEPLLCHEVNLSGTLNILEIARQNGARRVVLSSSNVALAGPTLYRSTKRAIEEYAQVYNELYGVSVIALRYSNVYGMGQKEDGIGPNVFAAFRKQKRELGQCIITGDGLQSRDFTHVSDIVDANLLAAKSSYSGTVDICTGRALSMNYIVQELFQAKAIYVDERPGDIKHIIQDPSRALEILGFQAKVRLEDGFVDVADKVLCPE